MKRWWLGIAVAATLSLSVAIAFNVSAALRGPEEWQWQYARPGQPIRALVLIVVLIIYASISQLLAKRMAQKRYPFGVLILIWLVAAVIQISYLAINDNPIEQLFARTSSPQSNGVFTVGAAIEIEDVGAFLTNYPERMPTFPVHPQRYPPGIALSFVPVRHLFEGLPTVSDPIAHHLRLYQCVDFDLMRLNNATIASAVWQMALPLLSSLVIYPLFWLADRICKRDVAIVATLIYPVVPSFVLWTGRWDQFYPFIAVLSWALLAVGLQSSHRLRYVALLLSGGVLAAGSFLSFGLLSLLAPMGMWAICWLLWQKRSLWSAEVWRDGAFFALGLVAPWTIYQLIVGNGFVDILRVSMGFHMGIRTYSTWLYYHLYDFGLFLGVPIVVLFLAAVRGRPKTGGQLLTMGFLLGFLLLNLSGLAQGEVARVWLFLTPFPVLAAAAQWAAWDLTKHTAGLILLMGIQVVLLGMFIRPTTTGVLDLPQYERVFERTQPQYDHNASLDTQVDLIGYDVTQTANTIDMTLHWEAVRPLVHPYTVFLHLVDEQGNLVAQVDGMPRNQAWPTTCWQPGEFVVDPHRISLPHEIAAGQYTVYTGMYWLETGERLETATPDNRIEITTLTID